MDVVTSAGKLLDRASNAEGTVADGDALPHFVAVIDVCTLFRWITYSVVTEDDRGQFLPARGVLVDTQERRRGRHSHTL